MGDVPVVWWDGKPGTWWDQGMLEEAMDGSLWRQQDGYTFDFTHAMPMQGGCVLMVPGRFFADDASLATLNAELRRLEWCLVIVTSDEETLLDISKLALEDERYVVWQMTPRPQQDADPDKYLGEYRPRDTAMLLPLEPPETALDVYFAGQVTHRRRTDCAWAIRDLGDDVDTAIVETPGFQQGLERYAYLQHLAAAKVAPCPGGPATPDSFRLYEALEAHVVPIADDFPAAKGYPPGYWDKVLPGHPFPVIQQWRELRKYVDAILEDWPNSSNRCAAWWMDYKRQLVADLHDTVERISGLPRPLSCGVNGADLVTVIMPTSPILSHPDTAIVEQVVASVRFHLPNVEVVIAADGVRPEQERLRGRYEEYLRRLLWLADHRWQNVSVELHDEHQHQANVTRAALERVRTPCILFVEHDTPIWPEHIDWLALITCVRQGIANVVRFHHEAHVLDVHQHLMVDKVPHAPIDGAPMLRTVQWSQRPHLASTGYYRTMLDAWFPATSRTMIEDRMHGVLENAWRRHGAAGWEQHRVWMYAPGGGDIKRSGHLDGRGSEPKYDMEFG